MSDLYITNRSAAYRDDLCRCLSEAGFRLFRFEEGDLPVRNLFGKAFLKDPAALLRRERPAHVIVPEFSGISIQLARMRKRFGFKVLSLCDDSLDMIAGNDFSRVHRMARKWLPRELDGIIALSPAVAQWYQAHFKLKAMWMPLIHDERRIRPELERVLPLSEELRPSRKPVIAFVGRFVGLKNIPTLIEAFRPLKDRAQLVLIGDGPEREKLKAMAPEALFPGMLSGDTLLAWYNLIDILALPSTQEAYGAVTGEALMAGAHVVVSARAGSRDLVREGENGFIVDPLDVQGLTYRLEQLLEGIPEGRPLALRENLLPYRFRECMDRLIQEINSL